MLSIHIWSYVTTPTTVVYPWPQVTPATLMAVVTTARNTNEPSNIKDLDNNPTEVKYFLNSQLEPKKPQGWKVKHLKVSTTKSSCPQFNPS